MTVYYFSGTGNSLYSAKRLIEEAGGGKAVPIASLPDEGRIEIDDESIGIVFPVYSHTMPRIVGRFASRLSAAGRPYVFAVATHNGGPGLALRDLSRKLSETGLALDAGFDLLMPGNSVIIRDYTNPPGEREARLRRAEDSMRLISSAVKGRVPHPFPRGQGLGDGIEQALTSLGRRLYRLPRHFRADSSCNGCGACVRVCPRANIARRGKPSWGNDCEECLACFHNCPKRAIQIDSYTEGRLRYRHPAIGFEELCARKD